MKCCERSRPGPAADRDFNHLVSAKAAAKQAVVARGLRGRRESDIQDSTVGHFQVECMPSPFA